MARSKGTPRKYEPTEEADRRIESMAAVGISHEQIAAVLKISVDTLTKYYTDTLKTARTKANTAIAGALYKNAIKGNVTAQIFWLKTRAGWREVENSETIDRRWPSKIEVIEHKKPTEPIQ